MWCSVDETPWLKFRLLAAVVSRLLVPSLAVENDSISTCSRNSAIKNERLHIVTSVLQAYDFLVINIETIAVKPGVRHLLYHNDNMGFLAV